MEPRALLSALKVGMATLVPTHTVGGAMVVPEVAGSAALAVAGVPFVGGVVIEFTAGIFCVLCNCEACSIAPKSSERLRRARDSAKCLGPPQVFRLPRPIAQTRAGPISVGEGAFAHQTPLSSAS